MPAWRVTREVRLQGLPLLITPICSTTRRMTLRPLPEFSRTDPSETRAKPADVWARGPCEHQEKLTLLKGRVSFSWCWLS